MMTDKRREENKERETMPAKRYIVSLTEEERPSSRKANHNRKSCGEEN